MPDNLEAPVFLLLQVCLQYSNMVGQKDDVCYKKAKHTSPSPLDEEVTVWMCDAIFVCLLCSLYQMMKQTFFFPFYNVG